MSSLTARLRSRVSVAPVLRSYGILGKDLYRYLGITLALAATCWLMDVAPRLLSALFGEPRGGGFTGLYPRMMLVAAYTIGMAASFEEREQGTWALLRSLPIARWHILVGKLLAALLLWALYLGISAVLVGGGRWSTSLMPEQGQEYTLALAALFTGFTMPLLLPPNLVLVALSGPVALFLYGSAVQALWSSQWFPYAGRDGMTGVFMGIWIVAMIAVAAKRIRNPEWSLLPGATVAVQGMSRPKSRRAFDPPARHHLKWAFRALLLLAGGVLLAARSGIAFSASSLSGGDVLTVFFLLLLSGPLLGAAAFSPGERLRTQFQLFALPVTRGRLFRERMAALAWRALVLALAAPAVGIYASLEIEKAPHQTTIIFLACTCLTVFSSAFVCATFTLFTRVKFFAVILTALLEIPWLLVVVGGVAGAVTMPIWGGAEIIWGLGWQLLVMAGLPLLVGWLAFCRSPLLELGEARRSLIGLLAWLLLATWGTLLLAVSPYHLVIMLLG